MARCGTSTCNVKDNLSLRKKNLVSSYRGQALGGGAVYRERNCVEEVERVECV